MNREQRAVGSRKVSCHAQEASTYLSQALRSLARLCNPIGLPSQLTLHHKALSVLLPSFIQQNSFSHLVFYFDVPGIKKQMVPSSHFLSMKL